MADLNLSKLAPPRGARTKKVRLGRGESSGVGKTAGRGGKGQKGRNGATIRRGFEGGQMPLYKRIPKLGFFSRKKSRGENVFEIVSLDALEKLGLAAVDKAALFEKGIVSKNALVKILGSGKLSKKVAVTVDAVSASARKQIEAAGGSVSLIGGEKASEKTETSTAKKAKSSAQPK